MIVRVNCDEFFPADLVLLKSSEPKGVCYVETKNLDGETNLKHKMAEKVLNKSFAKEDIIHNFRCKLICEEANDLIYKFEGTMFLPPGAHSEDTIVLGSENLLLRGSSLRNTEYILGMIVYAGHQTKIMMNSTTARFKMSKIERETNKQILIVFIVQVICCFIGAIIGTFIQFDLYDASYLSLPSNFRSAGNAMLTIVKQTGTWILIFT